MSVYELTAKELFAWYVNGDTVQEVIQQGRAEIAARLQKEERLAEKDAFYAADRILEYANKLQTVPEGEGEQEESQSAQ